MKEKQAKLSLETFNISKLNNLKSIWGGNENGGDNHIIKLSSKVCLD